MYQDNLSAMHLDNNGILSSDNQTKYIRIRYSLIKDRIKMGYLNIKYCLMEKILASHFTKPLKGAAFQIFRAEIQGILEGAPDTG